MYSTQYCDSLRLVFISLLSVGPVTEIITLSIADYILYIGGARLQELCRFLAFFSAFGTLMNTASE